MGWLTRVDKVLSEGLLFKGSQYLRGAAFVALLLIMVVNFLNIVIRRSPWAGPWMTGAFEISDFSMAMLSVMACAHTWYLGGHVRVAILREHVSRRKQAAIDLFSAFLALFWMPVIAWGLWGVALNNMQRGVGTGFWGAGSMSLHIPYAPFQFIFAVVMAHFFLVLLRSVVGLILYIAGRHVEHLPYKFL